MSKSASGKAVGEGVEERLALGNLCRDPRFNGHAEPGDRLPGNYLRAGGAYVHDPDAHNLEFLTTRCTDEFLTSL